VYKDLKDYEKAKDLFTQSLIICEAHYGENHVRIAPILQNLGVVHIREGKFEIAEQLLVQALAIFRQSQHPEIYSIFEDLAELSLNKSAKDKENPAQSQAFIYNRPLRLSKLISQKILHT
jgi:tetratricopeptide (TPR) repeat protein